MRPMGPATAAALHNCTVVRDHHNTVKMPLNFKNPTMEQLNWEHAMISGDQAARELSLIHI